MTTPPNADEPEPAAPNPMKIALLITAACCLASLTGCEGTSATVQAGYLQVAIDGDIALSPTAGGSTPTIRQDIESGLGLGDPVGTPYARVQLDLGLPVLTVSGFQFEESGSGRLDAQFGNLVTGTDVTSEMRFSNLKANLLFDLDLGPATLSPGLGIDLIDLDVNVQDLIGLVREDVNVTLPVPMLFLRGAIDLEWAALVAEVGYMHVPEYDNAEGTFWDVEALLEVRPTPSLFLFGGYRLISLDARGEADGQDIDTNLQVSGFVIGGGLRF